VGDLDSATPISKEIDLQTEGGKCYVEPMQGRQPTHQKHTRRALPQQPPLQTLLDCVSLMADGMCGCRAEVEGDGQPGASSAAGTSTAPHTEEVDGLVEEVNPGPSTSGSLAAALGASDPRPDHERMQPAIRKIAEDPGMMQRFASMSTEQVQAMVSTSPFLQVSVTSCAFVPQPVCFCL